MAETELTMPTHLDQIVGTAREVLAKKSALIAKFGFSSWETLVANSARSTKK
jgi:hypothetical protein